MVNIKCVFFFSGRPFFAPACPLPLLTQAALHLHRTHHHGAKGQDGANRLGNIQLDNVSNSKPGRDSPLTQEEGLTKWEGGGEEASPHFLAQG